jgi:hypothetical protein
MDARPGVYPLTNYQLKRSSPVELLPGYLHCAAQLNSLAKAQPFRFYGAEAFAFKVSDPKLLFYGAENTDIADVRLHPQHYDVSILLTFSTAIKTLKPYCHSKLSSLREH